MRCRNLLAVAALALAACGGGGGGGGGDGPPLTPAPPDPNANVQPVSVGGGPTDGVNLLLTSVTICTPGSTTQCQTIDDILVDTGSYGLRVMASALNGRAAPTAVRSSANIPLVECTQFADGFTWGPVRRADVRIASEVAANIPIQIIGDSGFPTAPAACRNTGDDNGTVASFGANGVLGVGAFDSDCGPHCVGNVNNGLYYECNGSVCGPATAPLTSQVRNPVAAFAVDNNGVVIDLPAVPAQGAATLNGALIFGIGTQGNNGLGNARVLDLSATGSAGIFPTAVGSQRFPLSFVDSGSNGLFFPYGAALTPSALPTCGANTAAPEFFCPPSTQTYGALLQGFANGSNVAVDFSIANAVAMLEANPIFNVFPNLGAPISGQFASSFDWGLPFHFGRRVYTALEGRSTPAGSGPYVAF